MGNEKKKAQIMLDIILPKHMSLDPNTPSDSEAGALYSLWKQAQPGVETFLVPPDMMRHMNSWKAKGLVDGLSSDMVLTDKGRKLIREMVTNEPNVFSKNAHKPQYSAVKAKKQEFNAARMNKSASKKPFNLKKARNDNQSSK